jgi:hypothetical protein
MLWDRRLKRGKCEEPDQDRSRKKMQPDARKAHKFQTSGPQASPRCRTRFSTTRF